MRNAERLTVDIYPDPDDAAAPIPILPPAPEPAK